MQQSEADKLIAFAAHQRQIQNQTDISIVVDKSTDDILTKQVKAIIRNMTHVSPQRRSSARDVQQKLNAMVRKHNFTIPDLFAHYVFMRVCLLRFVSVVLTAR